MISEDAVEQQSLEWLRALGYATAFGPEIAHDSDYPERDSYNDVILTERLKTSLARINRDLPEAAIDEAIRQIEIERTASLYENNRAFHKHLTEGVQVGYRDKDEQNRNEHVQLVDWENPEKNDWLAVNQFTVIGKSNRRPDIVIFINGLPLVVIELKNPADEDATIDGAYNQILTYKKEIRQLFDFNAFSVISDGLYARMGSITAEMEWFKPWKTVDGETRTNDIEFELKTLIHGVFRQEFLLDLIRNFIVISGEGAKLTKKIAGYHQFHAVRKAVDSTVRASHASQGDRKAGVIWHTQGSGKCLTMAFYAGRIARHAEMKNPTIVVLTDRNDLDEQLFDTFAECSDVLAQNPVQAMDTNHLRSLLDTAGGGVIFTTLQKFRPENPGQPMAEISRRSNIVFIADEAHRSQYGLTPKYSIDDAKGELHRQIGFAAHVRSALPNATFIGFTGTPVDEADRSTRSVFGDEIDIYDIKQAVDDNATVPILYQSRLVPLSLPEEGRELIDQDFSLIVEDEEEEVAEGLKSRWSQLKAMVGSEPRLARVAADIVEHFEQRQEAMHGKAMIVTMSRDIAVRMYDELIKLRPEWHSEDFESGALKVVITGSAADPPHIQKHVYTKQQRKELRERLKDPESDLQIAIVCDMWLTGTDLPCLMTMYMDKPLRSHNLMQAIARVNRVFRDKPGGLIVDYLGLAQNLKLALAQYTQDDRELMEDRLELARAKLREMLQVVRDMYHGFDYSGFFEGEMEERLMLLPAAMEHVLSLTDGKKRYNEAVTQLSTAFSLIVPDEEAMEHADEIAFFQAVRAGIMKQQKQGGRPISELDHAVNQLISRSVTPDEIVDVFEAAGLGKAEIGLLSDEFLEEVRQVDYKNLAIEALRRMLEGNIKTKMRSNVVQSRQFSDMLAQAIKRYINRTIDSAQVLDELINLAKEMNEALKRGDKLGLNEAELAFYDALETNEASVRELGDEVLKKIAQELTTMINNSVTIDWQRRENVRARLRVYVKKILKKYKYPPDMEQRAIDLVLKQAEVVSEHVPVYREVPITGVLRDE